MEHCLKTLREEDGDCGVKVLLIKYEKVAARLHLQAFSRYANLHVTKKDTSLQRTASELIASFKGQLTMHFSSF